MHDEVGRVGLDDRGGAGRAEDVHEVGAERHGRRGGEVGRARVLLTAADDANAAVVAFVLRGGQRREETAELMMRLSEQD